MRRHALVTVTATVLAVGTLVALPGTVTSTVHVADWVPPCEHEDSTGPCYWDAQRMGNGAGRSFVVTPGGVTYLDRGF